MLSVTAYPYFIGEHGEQLAVYCFWVKFSEIGSSFDVNSSIEPWDLGWGLGKFSKKIAIVGVFELIAEFNRGLQSFWIKP